VADVYVVHWNEAEARERAERVERAGHRVRCGWDEGGGPARELKQRPPDVVVVDLGRLPSHGRQLALWLRGHRRTQHVPLVFIEGDREKTDRLRRAFPGDVFTPWSRIRSALKRALKAPPPRSAPPATADYSGTPLPKKLGIRPGSAVALLGAPDGFERTLGALPDDVRLKRRAGGSCDVILLFVRTESVLRKRFGAAQRALADRGGLWVCWPKKASGLTTDVTQAVVRAVGLDAGLVDNKICAVDATWSGQRFVRRRTT